MDRKAKRNKEVHTAKVILLAGTQVRDLMTGESFFVPKKTEYFGWYLPEKFQWFYWNLFFTDSSGKERLVMVRRDKATMKSGTHRTCHREVMQNKMKKVLRAGLFNNNTRLPLPPKEDEKRIEVCPKEWKELYQSFHSLIEDKHTRRPWSEESKEKIRATLKAKKEAKAIEAGLSNLEDCDMPDSSSPDWPEHSELE